MILNKRPQKMKEWGRQESKKVYDEAFLLSSPQFLQQGLFKTEAFVSVHSWSRAACHKGQL